MIERMPLSNYFPSLEKYTLDFGGESCNLGVIEIKQPIQTTSNNIKAASSICFETLFSYYLTEIVNNGANLIVNISNDGWWGESSGYKMLMAFSRLRAIEARRYVARAANTGISAIINQKGDVIEKIDYNKAGVIKGIVLANSEKTFYTRYGKWLVIIPILIACFSILSIINRLTMRQTK